MARTALFCSIDLDVPVIRALGHRMYVVDARCRYMSPLVYGDTATIIAWFTAVAPLIRVAYDISKTQAAMRKSGFADFLINRLSEGR